MTELSTQDIPGRFLVIHGLRPTVAVNLNAGQDRRPKSIRMGGVKRQRVSSQSRKRAMREIIRQSLDKVDHAPPTRSIPGHVADKVYELAGRVEGLEYTKDHALHVTALALSLVGYEPSVKPGQALAMRRLAEKRTEPYSTTAGFAQAIVDHMAENPDEFAEELPRLESFTSYEGEMKAAPLKEALTAANKGTGDILKTTKGSKRGELNYRVALKATKKTEKTEERHLALMSALKAEIRNAPNAEVALSGRFLASSQEYGVDSSYAVAHSVSTDAVVEIDDFWTSGDEGVQADDPFADGGFDEDLPAAADDDEPAERSDNANVGNTILSSGTLYEYAVFDRETLRENLRKSLNGEKAKVDVSDEEVEAKAQELERLFVHAALTAVPKGQNNSTGGAGSPLAYALILGSKSQPLSATAAFERPVVSVGDKPVYHASTERLLDFFTGYQRVNPVEGGMSLWLAPALTDKPELPDFLTEA